MVEVQPLPSRAERCERVERTPPQVVVVGGGITGAGVALDLALRGVRTLLVERGDWAGATSSASSRLVHGGLRYLEQFDFGLVRESCLERALLLRNAAGLVWPERFVFPVRRGDRTGLFKLALGLGLYTLLSVPRALGLPGLLRARTVATRIPGVERETLVGAGHYLDAATDDARLTLAVVASAMRAGAVCLSRTEAIAIEHDERGASVRLADRLDGSERTLACRAVVLCGGPGTEELRARAGLGGRWITPTRGSHVLVPRQRLPTDGAVIFPSSLDGRVMFLIPWPRATAIGTTDIEARADVEPRATRAEVEYLLESANALVPHAKLGPDDVLSTWSGLRPLLASEADPSARSREERIVREGSVFTIAGGKLTGYRAVAENLSATLTGALGIGRSGRRSPTRDHTLVGAERTRVARPAWSRWSGALPPDALADAWRKRYGARREAVRAACESMPGGLEPLDAETLLGEVDWSVRHEDCFFLDDFFFRRTDLGYAGPEAVEAAVEAVLGRLGERLSWDASRRDDERTRFAASLARRHAWRKDGREQR